MSNRTLTRSARLFEPVSGAYGRYVAATFVRQILVVAGGPTVETRGLVTYSGTLGLHLEPPRAKVVTAAWPAGASLVLWTDGLSTRVELTAGEPLLDRDPAVVAAALHRDHARNRDDATVVVGRRPAVDRRAG